MQFRCALCAAAGKKAQHRLGAMNCGSLSGNVSLDREQAVATPAKDARDTV